jgi:hypothetical protein
VLDAGFGEELIRSPSACGIPSGVCRIVYVPEAEMEAAVIHSAPEPYTTQPFDITTNIPAPVKNATNLEAARNTITELGEAVENEYNSSLDPENWERPGPNGSPPGGLTVVWPKANQNETYANYVARLRDLGWLGTATVHELDANTGNVDFGLDGVPCTSVQTGSRVLFNVAVTFLHNPTTGSFDDDLGPTSGLTCGDATPTSESEPKCSFAPHHGTWESITAQNPFFYQLACESTRSYVASLSPFQADGAINTAAITIARDIAVGDQIYDRDLRAAIAGGPYTIDDFRYVSSQRLFDDDGREFELHFFVNDVTGKVVLSRGFKIRWIYLFGPS